jgi:hypothetical protein
MKPLERFVHTEPNDADCDEMVRFLHVYADALLAGEDPSRTTRHRRASAPLPTGAPTSWKACSPP